jgi:hypothetical protein
MRDSCLIFILCSFKAVRYGHETIVESLLLEGADKYIQDKYGFNSIKEGSFIYMIYKLVI